MMRNLTTALICVYFISLQSCSDVDFSAIEVINGNGTGTGNPVGCDPLDITCVPPPLVSTPGVVTILLAFGDKDNLPSPTVDQVSAQLVAEKMVQYASPVVNPRVLVVLDNNHQNESPDDFQNLWQNLLKRYSPDHIDEPIGGLREGDLAAYDVVWLVNPGHAMGSVVTYNTLKNFSGGVIVSGDDMSRGEGFSTSELTGLNYIDNGVSVVCAGQTYPINNNLDPNTYIVMLDPVKFFDLEATRLSFNYGNDIDLTTVNPGIEVLVTAKPSPASCQDERPVVVRYPKR